MNTFALIISTPDGDVYNGRAAMLVVRGTEGELAVMAGHTPFVTTVVPCDCKIEPAHDGEEIRIGHTDGGVLSVARDTVTLLTGRFVFRE